MNKAYLLKIKKTGAETSFDTKAELKAALDACYTAKVEAQGFDVEFNSHPLGEVKKALSGNFTMNFVD